MPFTLYGEKGLMAFVEKILSSRGHAVICIAEGAGQVPLLPSFWVSILTPRQELGHISTPGPLCAAAEQSKVVLGTFSSGSSASGGMPYKISVKTSRGDHRSKCVPLCLGPSICRTELYWRYHRPLIIIFLQAWTRMAVTRRSCCGFSKRGIRKFNLWRVITEGL